MNLRVRCLAALVLVGASSRDARAEKFDLRTANFAVAFKGERSAYRDTSVFVMPAATVIFEVLGGPPGDYALIARDGIAVQQSARKWRFTAPERPGLALSNGWPEGAPTSSPRSYVVGSPSRGRDSGFAAPLARIGVSPRRRSRTRGFCSARRPSGVRT